MIPVQYKKTEENNLSTTNHHFNNPTDLAPAEDAFSKVRILSVHVLQNLNERGGFSTTTDHIVCDFVLQITKYKIQYQDLARGVSELGLFGR